MLGRMPTLLLVVLILEGAPLLLTIGLLVVSTLPSALLYRYTLNVLADLRSSREREAARGASKA